MTAGPCIPLPIINISQPSRLLWTFLFLFYHVDFILQRIISIGIDSLLCFPT